MSAIAFYIQYAVLSLLALLPMCILYVVADGMYFILYYIVRYRIKIIRENLRHAFPDKSDLEVLQIEKAFYRNFADMIVESLKMVHMSQDQLSKRIPLLNPEILDTYRNSGRSVVAVGAHYCNWEWTLGIVPFLKYETIGVYKPLNNKRFDNLVNHTRSRFNTRMVSMREVIRVLMKYQKDKIPTFNVFIADQSPVWEEVQYWIPFMNQLTAVYLGPEKIARQFNMVVLYGKVSRTGRGRYSVELIPIEENPMETNEFEITTKFFRILENQIRSAPENWLWSHRRWKLTRRREKEERNGIFRFTGKNTRK